MFRKGLVGKWLPPSLCIERCRPWARTRWPPTDFFWQCVRDIWVSERVPALAPECTRQRRAGHSTLLHDPSPQGQLSLLLYGGVQFEPNGDSLTWKGGDQLSFDKCRFISGVEKWNGDFHSCLEDIVPLVQKVGNNKWKAVVFPICTWTAELPCCKMLKSYLELE